MDLRDYPLAGVEVLDRYRYRVRVHGKYPQFLYWLAMPFFAPVPWEADAFYSRPGMKERNISLDWYPLGTGPYMLTVNNPIDRWSWNVTRTSTANAIRRRVKTGDAEAGLSG